MASDKSGFFEELKRRHVWRVAAAYAVVGWLVVQIATQVFPAFHMPDWTAQFVVLLVVIGFPIALVLAWAFELTPDGIRRTAPADSPEGRHAEVHRQISRKLDVVIIAVLAVAVGFLGWRQLALRPVATHAGYTSSADGALRNPGAAIAESATVAPPLPASSRAVPEKSVAVLPFANESGKAEEQFFSDGLSDDLINALSQFDGLKVISRNSAFQFRDSKDDTATIGRKLGVAHLLEGSVQRAADAVRITATLVNASDGSIVWSERYDKPYKDLFALQDAITRAVADALKAKLMTAPGAVVQSDRPPSGSLAAYTAYQRGFALMRLNTKASLRESIECFDEAIRIDPGYAAAYAQLSYAWVVLAGQYLGISEWAQAAETAGKVSAAALRLDSDLAAAHYTHAMLLEYMNMDWTGAEGEFRRALQLAPNDPAAQFGLGNLLATLGQNRRAVELTRQALAGDPRYASWYDWLAMYEAALGRLDSAGNSIDTAIALQPGATHNQAILATILILRGEPESAIAAAQRELPGVWRASALALALQIGPDRAAADTALAKLIEDHSEGAGYQIAQVYALRRDPDKVFHWLDRAWTARDSGIIFLLFDPFILRYRDDPRFAAFCRKVGLPTATDAVAMK